MTTPEDIKGLRIWAQAGHRYGETQDQTVNRMRGRAFALGLTSEELSRLVAEVYEEQEGAA